MTLAPSTWIFCIQTFFTRAFIEIYMSLVISWLTIFWRSKSTKHPDTLLDLVFVLKWVKRGIVWTLSVFYAVAVAADFSKFCHQLSFSRLEKKRDRGECRNHVAIISLSVNLRIKKLWNLNQTLLIFWRRCRADLFTLAKFRMKTCAVLCSKTHDVLSTHLQVNVFVTSSVTRLGDLLDFGEVFKAFGNN